MSDGATKRINIDGEKLKSIIYEKGFKVSQIEKEFGCGHELGNSIQRNKIAQPLLTLLSLRYGIDEADILPSTSNPHRTPTEPDEIIIAPQISDEQWDKLKGLIKDAILEAMNEYLYEATNDKSKQHDHASRVSRTRSRAKGI